MTFIACNGHFGYNKIPLSMKTLLESINSLFQLPFSYYYLILTFGLVSYVYGYSRDFFLLATITFLFFNNIVLFNSKKLDKSIKYQKTL